VKQAVRRFIKERVTEQDVVALATSGQTLGLAQQFTRDRQLLGYAAEQIRFGPKHDDLFTPTLAAAVVAERVDAFTLAVDMMRREYNINCPCARLLGYARDRAVNILSETSYSRKATLSILKDFAEQMIRLPGKRMIVVFSDGFSLYDSDTGIHTEEVQAAIDRAVRSGVVIYSIDAKGLQIPPTFDAGRGLVTPNPSKDTEADPNCRNEDPTEVRCLPPDPGIWETFMNTSEREEQNGLYAIANQTGGEMFPNSNDLGVALGRAFDANQFYYVLSYYLSAGRDGQRFRNIKVRVPKHPEYKVRTARGYSVSDATARLDADATKTPQQRLIKAMKAPLPLSDLGISAQADFVETEADDRQVSLNVYFQGDRFQYRQKDQRNFIELEILSAIFDTSGKQVEAVSAHVEGNLTAAGLKKAKTSGYRFSRRLTLGPGVYQLRIGVREVGTDRMGTAAAWVDVPEIRSGKLAMSSLILRSPLDIEIDSARTADIKVGDLEQIQMIQGIPLYAQGDFCDYSFRVHSGALISPDLAVMMELLRDGKPIRQEPWRQLTDEEKIADKKGWVDLDGEVNLGGLDSGIYELRVSVKEAPSNKTVQRTIVFGLE
jgi:VWFA-related protein